MIRSKFIQLGMVHFHTRYLKILIVLISLYTALSFSMSRPGNQFFQSIQIQPPRHQFVADDKTGSPRDAEVAAEGPILVHDGLQPEATDTAIKCCARLASTQAER